jgi:tRNA(Ile)-lysidine synthetase-like protein
VEVFHLDHLTRQGASTDDARFLGDYCAAQGIPLHCFTHDFGSTSGFEERARIMRYQLLEQLCTKQEIQYAATAHTANDNAETIIMRICRGTGIHGLQGIPPRRGAIIRPLARITSAAIVRYNRFRALEWREDSTNRELECTRNIARHVVLPAMDRICSDSVRALNLLAENAVECQGLLENLAERALGTLMEQDSRGVRLRIDSIMDNAPLLRYYLARMVNMFPGEHVDRNMLHIIPVVILRTRKTQCELFRSKTLVFSLERDLDHVWLRVGSTVNAAGVGGQVFFRGVVSEKEWVSVPLRDGLLQLRVCDFGDMVDHTGTIIGIPSEPADIVIRSRLTADRIVTLAGHKTLKRLYIDRKIRCA